MGERRAEWEGESCSGLREKEGWNLGEVSAQTRACSFASPKTWSRAWAGPVSWLGGASLSSSVSETDREVEINQFRRLNRLPGTKEETGVEQAGTGREKY